jgi:hypothetical protein
MCQVGRMMPSNTGVNPETETTTARPICIGSAQALDLLGDCRAIGSNNESMA